jgi:hypothetical protein
MTAESNHANNDSVQKKAGAVDVPGDKLKAVRAVYDILGGDRNESGDLVNAIPSRYFGKQRARILRKLVLLAIAKNANADGANAWPSLETIACRCLVTTEAVRKAMRWLVKRRLLKVESKGAPTSKFGRTNRYTILFPKPKKKASLFPKSQKKVTKCSKHPQIEVAGAQTSLRANGIAVNGGEHLEQSHEHREAPTTMEGSTPNNGGKHLQQWKVAPTNRKRGTTVLSTVPIDRPCKPSNQPHGWLAARLTSLYGIRAAGSSIGACVLIQDEIEKLNGLAAVRGDLPVLLAFYQFLNRERGFDGIQWPFRMFLNGADTWIEQAMRVSRERGSKIEYMAALNPAKWPHADNDLRDKVGKILIEYGWKATPKECVQLRELAYTHADFDETCDSFSVDAVRDYLKNHPQQAQAEGSQADNGEVLAIQPQDAVPETKTKVKASQASEKFTRLWQIYPWKRARPPALEAFLKLNPSEALLTTIIASVEAHKKSKQWKNPDFSINLSKFLNEQRWEDVLAAPSDPPMLPRWDDALMAKMTREREEENAKARESQQPQESNSPSWKPVGSVA